MENDRNDPEYYNKLITREFFETSASCVKAAVGCGIVAVALTVASAAGYALDHMHAPARPTTATQPRGPHGEPVPFVR